MSDSEDDLTDSMSAIHSLIEKLSHESKSIYSKALKISAFIDNPNINIWIEEFQLHENAYETMVIEKLHQPMHTFVYLMDALASVVKTIIANVLQNRL
jgi:hypothetical protein